MSGTSFDGIDISIISSNGKKIKRLNKNFYYPFTKRIKTNLTRYSNYLKDNLDNKLYLAEANDFITKIHFEAINSKCFNEDYDFIGFHGQTILHKPKNKLSIQLGNPQLLSNLTNKKVIFNFRDRDIKNSGQGAPLAPIFHKYLLEENKIELPACILNIGGVSNLTYWDGINLIGFDIGPGNTLMDRHMEDFFKKPYDDGGNMASRGNPNHNFIFNIYLKDSYFDKKFPKSLDKHYFDKYYEILLKTSSNHYDIMATLLEMTVLPILYSIYEMPKRTKSLLITGGGFNNKYLVNKIFKNCSYNLKQANFLKENIFSPDFIESELISFLSARYLYKLPITFPKTTGVKRPLTGGKLYEPIKNLFDH